MSQHLESSRSEFQIPRPDTPEALQDLKTSLDIRHKRRAALMAGLLKAKTKREKHVAYSLLTQNNLFMKAIARALWEAHNSDEGK